MQTKLKMMDNCAQALDKLYHQESPLTTHKGDKRERGAGRTRRFDDGLFSRNYRSLIRTLCKTVIPKSCFII